MLSLNIGKKYDIAIQIKDHVIRYVATKQHSLSHIHSYGEKYLPDGIIEKGKIINEASFNLILEELTDEWKLRNQRVMFFVPDASVFFRKISVPGGLPEEEIRGYLNFEIGSTIHLPFEEAYFDYYIIDSEIESEENKARELLFFAAPETIVSTYAHKLEEFKMDPVAADISALSFYRLFNRTEEVSPDEHYLFIEWDLTSVNLSIFHEDKPVFMRHLPPGTEEERWEIDLQENQPADRGTGDISVRDQLTEIERVYNFYKFTLNKGEQEVTKILLAGDHPRLKEIKSKLEEAFPARTTELVSSLSILEDTNETLSYQYILPLSLCLKEVR
ncbi:type IV pilus biogenesis protein PilM [Evansella clarkii]|uniref:type IV pilus biogenesis protein PilM n=1 Tax=Evansella clarkii TaxID=79879 RepID=UPI000B44A0A5|nr:pilus assembly protein PilM [Evansella clarkii]